MATGSGHALKKVRAGQQLRVPAQAYNAFVDAAVDLQQRRLAQLVDPERTFKQSAIIPVKNNSGGDRGRFEVLGLDDILFSPAQNLQGFQNQPVLVGVTPVLTQHTGRFGVLLQPAKAGAIAQACLDGVTTVKVEVVNPDHAFAEMKDGSTSQLKSSSFGSAQILWKESGTGTKWAVVRLGNRALATGLILAKITGNAELAPNRWKYSWIEQELQADGITLIDKPGGLVGTLAQDFAINLVETFNTGTHVSPGVWLESDAYPAGFSLVPIGFAGDGTPVNTVVGLWPRFDVAGNLRYVFWLANDHDGSCGA